MELGWAGTHSKKREEIGTEIGQKQKRISSLAPYVHAKWCEASARAHTIFFFF